MIEITGARGIVETGRWPMNEACNGIGKFVVLEARMSFHAGFYGNVWGASRQSVQACKQCSTFARYESNGVLAFLHVSPPTLSPQLQRKYSNNPWNESIMSFRSPSSQSPASQFVSDFAGPPMANPHVRRLLH